MVQHSDVAEQLKRLGVVTHFWNRQEIKQLPHVLMPGEQINAVVTGRYEGGVAILCATDQRLLLIDKKPMYLTVEDIRYDMIAEVDFHNRLMESTINVCTTSKTLLFTSFKQKPVRDMTNYVQQRVMEFRQQHMMMDMPQQTQQQYAPQGQTGMAYEYTQAAEYSQTTGVPSPFAETVSNRQVIDQPVMEDQLTDTLPTLDMPQFKPQRKVRPLHYRVTNPYTKVPLMMRRRVSRFYNF